MGKNQIEIQNQQFGDTNNHSTSYETASVNQMLTNFHHHPLRKATCLKQNKQTGIKNTRLKHNTSQA